MQQNMANLLMGRGRAGVVGGARALPEPTTLGSRLYAWFYQFTHLLLANFDKVGIANDVQSGSH
jgi:hypothetical protein